jgi:biopolymer transport protein ExbD
MAEIIQEEKGGGKKKAKKHAPHIDMTPMVDLMCLLITFFMLTSALSKPKIMQIILPDAQKSNEPAPRFLGSRTLNIILGPDNKIYTYAGTIKPEEYNNLPPLTETNYSATGIRQTLFEKNRTLAKKIADFKEQLLTGKIVLPPDSVLSSIAKLKKVDDTGPLVLIKAYKGSNYGNMVDILDEMNICGIALYMLVDINVYEEKMVETAAGITSTAKAASTK